MRSVFRLVLVVMFAFTVATTGAVPARSADGAVTIGGVLPLTGIIGSAGIHGEAGIRDAIAVANQEGGVNGKRVEIVIGDGRYKLDVGKQVFRSIMEKYNPPMMVGASTALSLAMAKDIRHKYKIMYGSASFSSKLAYAAMNPSIFVAGPTYGDQIGLLLRYIAKRKPRAKVAFFYSDSEFGRDPIKFGRIMCRRLRLNLVAEEVVPLGATTIKSQIMGLKQADPDWVVFQGFMLTPVPQVIKACRGLGMTCNFIGTFWTTTKTLVDMLGPLAEGFYGVNPYAYWWMEDVPMIRKIRAFNAEHHPDIQYRTNYYMQGFASGMICVEILRRADRLGGISYDTMVKALRSIEDFDTGGLTAPLTVKNNRFPVARIWKADTEKGIFVPETDWMKFYY